MNLDRTELGLGFQRKQERRTENGEEDGTRE